MAHYNFTKDLKVAQSTEAEVAKFLQDRYGGQLLGFCDTADYDFKMAWSTIRTYEVKEDFICETTGNVGLEYSCRGKLSGISVSKADYYIYKLHTRDRGIQYVQHKTETLRKMIADNLYFRTVNGGDPGSNSLFYLFKYEVWVAHGEIL